MKPLLYTQEQWDYLNSYLKTATEVAMADETAKINRLYGSFANYRRIIEQEERAYAVIPILETIDFRIAML